MICWKGDNSSTVSFFFKKMENEPLFCEVNDQKYIQIFLI